MEQSIGTLTSIIEELAQTLKLVQAPTEVQQIVNNFNDTLSDEEILEQLRLWNRTVVAWGSPPVPFPGEPDPMPNRKLTDEQLAKKYVDPEKEM